ncbi:MAG: AI-2E family transporter [Bacteroidota bacterium]|nr:AI-2E family transporter [Bacteroidota bacterium]
MNNITKNIIGGIVVVIALFLMWYFSNLVIYTLIALVISIIGRPIVKFLDRMGLGKLRLPHSLNTILTLLLIFGFVICLASIFVPLIVQQAKVIGSIDVNAIGVDVRLRLDEIQRFLHHYGFLRRNEKLDALLISKAKEIVNFSNFSDILGSIVNIASNLFIGLFSVIFISFFFLKDQNLFSNIILTLTPAKSADKIMVILRDTRILLTRYFSGVCIQLCIMMTIEATGLTLFGVPNALLIGTFGGMMNIIPYLGPLIGASVGIVLGVSSTVAMGNYHDIFSLIIIIIGVFSFANLVDNFVIQPFVFSNRVKAHPLEIFFVVLMAGSLAGVPGMILAIPSYTVLRVIAREFLDQFSVIQTLTKNL